MGALRWSGRDRKKRRGRGVFFWFFSRQGVPFCGENQYDDIWIIRILLS